MSDDEIMSDSELAEKLDEDKPDDDKNDDKEELSDLDDTEPKNTTNQDTDNEELSDDEEGSVVDSSDEEYEETPVDTKYSSNEAIDCYHKYAKDTKTMLVENKKLKVDDNIWNGYPLVPKKDRITGNRMTSYEYARVIGVRATQLEHGAPPLIKEPKNVSYQELAKLELISKKCPLFVMRPMNDGSVERWSCEELECSSLVAQDF